MASAKICLSSSLIITWEGGGFCDGSVRFDYDFNTNRVPQWLHCPKRAIKLNMSGKKLILLGSK